MVNIQNSHNFFSSKTAKINVKNSSWPRLNIRIKRKKKNSFILAFWFSAIFLHIFIFTLLSTLKITCVVLPFRGLWCDVRDFTFNFRLSIEHFYIFQLYDPSDFWSSYFILILLITKEKISRRQKATIPYLSLPPLLWRFIFINKF